MGAHSQSGPQARLTNHANRNNEATDEREINMQKQLTFEHTAKFAEHRAEWIAAGLSTASADFDRAEQAVRKIYQATCDKEPLVVLRMGSPYAAIMGGYLAWAMLDGLRVAGDGEVWQQVGQQVEQQVWQQVGQQVRQQVELQKISKKYGLSIYDYRAANLWAGWHAYVTFFIENGFLEGTTKAVEHYQLDREVAESCGLVWYSSAVATISDRPEALHRDEQGRLHCETGPAILYRDGWSIHAWHGTVVPAHWIDQRDSLTPGEILEIENVEQRAAGIAILGMAKFLALLPHKVIDADPDPMHGELLEVRLVGLPRPGRFLKAWCPRNGDICEGVPSNISTVLAAQAWRVGLEPHEFSYPTVRT